MRLLIVLICCLGALATDQQADSTEVQSSNKLTASKSSLNAIPSAPAQKTPQQTHIQYIPQYVVHKPAQHQTHSQQAAAMYIIAQPAGHQSGSQNTLFQQAVQQLLHYYSTNPQARYQLLQQQGGSVPQHQQITHVHPVPQGSHHAAPQALVQSAQQSHAAAYQHHPHMPSGALHVIPSPHLDNSHHLAQPQAHTQSLAQAHAQSLAQAHAQSLAQTQTHAPSLPQPQALTQSHASVAQGHHQSSNTNQPQAIYAIPASSQLTLSQLSPGLLAQLTGHSTPQQQTVPLQLQQYSQQHQHLLAQASAQPDITSQLGAHFGQNLGSHLGSQLGHQLGGSQLGHQLGGSQLGHQLGSSQFQFGSHGAQFYAQLPSNFGGQFQVPAHYALPSQFQGGYQHLQAQIPGGYTAQISGGQPQFSLKQNTASNGNEYVAQVVQQATPSAPSSEKNTQGQSSNYNPVYKTAYIKG